MSFVGMIIAGLICASIAKLLMRERPTGGLFILGLGGAFIGGMLQYSQGRPAGIVTPVVGAIILLALYAFVAEREAVRESEHKADHDDYKKAA